jgi:RpiR family carbohydrate utilization transcriptional regulator
VNEGVPYVHRAVSDDDTPAELVIKVIDNAVAALLKYRNAAGSHAFARAIEALAEAARRGRRIEFYGVGNSGIAAHEQLGAQTLRPMLQEIKRTLRTKRHVPA